MSDIEPAKLKVTELREELKKRGLDTKGNKPQLVKRLEKALQEEAGTDEENDAEAEAETGDTSQVTGTDVSLNESAVDTSVDNSHLSTTVADDDIKVAQEEPSSTPQPEQAVAELPTKMEEAEPVAVEAAREEVKPVVAEPMNEEPISAEQPDEASSAQAMDDVQVIEPKAEAEEGKPEVIKVDSGAEEADVKDTGSDGHAEKHREHRKRSRSPSEDRHRRRSRSRSPRRRHSRSRSHSPDRRRHRSRTPERVMKVEPEESDDWLTSTVVQLDRYNCDLSLHLDEAGYKATPMTDGGFAFMWTGAKSTYGITLGKICFEVKILEHLNVDHLPPEEANPHVVRVGFSAANTSLLLGEEKLSYGFGGTGKASTECKFRDYGCPFGMGDVITAYLDYSEENVVISFAKNGEDLGTCFDVPTSSLDGQVLFPHVLTKNCSFECNFGQLETPFFPVNEEFTFIYNIPEENRVRGLLPPAKKEDCEMIMMCGLPGCGKTTWVDKYTVSNREKMYNVLGTNNIIDKMKVMGLPRKRNYHGRWDVLIDLSTKCLNKQLEMSAKRKRNYILDQTNVYPSAQRRKMRPFEGFQRKAVVIVPTDEEFKRRCEQREKEEGKEIPDSAVLEMKANFQMPEEGVIFDKVEFIELPREEAQPLVEQYNKEGRAAQPDVKRSRGGGDRDRYGSRFGSQDRGRDYQRGGGYRGGYGDNRRGGGGYYNRDRDSRGGSYGGYNDRRGGSSGYQDRRRQDSYGSSGGYRDRRDNRGSGRDQGWSSGRSYQQQGSWNRQGSSQQGSGGWKSQGSYGGSWGGQSGGSSGGYGQSGWGGQSWSQQSYPQQSQAGGWGQWSGYGQQQQQSWGPGYSYPGWNQAAAASAWPTYGQQQGQGQSWNYGSGQYQK